MKGQETYSLNFGIYQNKNVMTKSGDDCNVTLISQAKQRTFIHTKVLD